MNNEFTTKDFTPEQLKLISDTIAKGATQNELKLFLYRCKTLGLDPLKPGAIHFIKYGTGPGTIVIGIEGFRSLAARTGKLAGIKRGVIKNDKGNLLAAWAEVYRSDWKECAREESPLAEYNTGKGPWAKMPETMLKKVAECSALRMAFPDDLGGVYESAEMDQAKQTITGDQPADDGSDGSIEDKGYKIPFGKYARRSLEEIDVNDLRSYVIYLEDKISESGKDPADNIKDFIKRATDYVGAIDNQPIGQQPEMFK